MSVILQLQNEKGATPYKINLKIVTPFMFIVPEPEQSTPVAVMFPETAPLKEFFINPTVADLNGLISFPLSTNLITNPNSVYNAKIQIVPFSFNLMGIDSTSSRDLFYKITNVHWKAWDETVDFGKISFITDDYPVKKIIPQNIQLYKNNAFDIFIDTTDITEDYTNSIIVEYEYDGTSMILETFIKITPALPQSDPVIVPVANSIKLDGSTKFTCNYPTTPAKPYDIIFFSPLGSDVLQFKIENIGESNAIIDTVELENPYIYLNDLYNIENKTNEDLLNITQLETHISEYESYHGTTNALYNNSNLYDSSTLVSLYDKISINNYITSELKYIDQPVNNSYKLQPITVFFNIYKFKKVKDMLCGLPISIKITYRKQGSNIKHTLYLYNNVNFNLKLIMGDISLVYDKDIEKTKYVRPNCPQTLYVKLFKKLTYDSC